MHRQLKHTRGLSRYTHRRRERRPEVSTDCKRLLAWIRRNRLVSYPEAERAPLRMTANAVLVLQFCLVLQSTSGYASVSSAGIAEEEGCCRRTVLRSLKALERTGLITLAAQYRDRRRIANRIRINWDHPYWKACAASDHATREVSDTSEPLSSDNLSQRNITLPVALAITGSYVPVSSSANDGPLADPPPAAHPDNPETTENPALKERQPDIPAWNAAVLTALILRRIGCTLQPSEAGWILKTCQKRRLTAHNPESVVRAIHDELAQRNGFDRLSLKRMNSPGAVINGAAHRVVVTHITNEVYENEQNTTNLLVHNDNRAELINNLNSAPGDVDPVKFAAAEAASAALLKRYTNPPVMVADPPATIDRDIADDMLRDRGVNADDFYDAVYKITQRPIWMQTAEEFSRVIDRFVKSKGEKNQ